MAIFSMVAYKTKSFEYVYNITVLKMTREITMIFNAKVLIHTEANDEVHTLGIAQVWH